MEARPAGQNFSCNDAGIPGAGRFQCWQWVSPTSNTPPGGNVQWVHDCANSGLVTQWWYHYEGAPFTVDSQTRENGGNRIDVWATNAGSTEGHFWITGRCRSA